MPKQLELNTLYPSKPIGFSCVARTEHVEVIALWYLDTEQGAEGQISPVSSKDVCTKASGCVPLSKGHCPLRTGYGDALNGLGVIVMEDVQPFSISDNKGQSFRLGKQPNRERGYQVWFGRTIVFASIDDAKA